MRSIRDETASAVLLYNSISWIPEANASSVGARPVVIRDRRDETADGVIGGCDVDEAEDSLVCD